MSLVRFRSEAPYAAVAHLVERHLAKVEVASSSLVGRSMGVTVVTPSFGPVAQLVRAPACHAGGRRFEPDPGRQHPIPLTAGRPSQGGRRVCMRRCAAVAHLVERHLAKVEVASSSLVGRSKTERERSHTVAWPSGKAKVCKTFIHQFKSGRHLQKPPCKSTGVFSIYVFLTFGRSRHGNK